LPAELIALWQSIVDQAAQVLSVRVALVTRIVPHGDEVVVASESAGNLYRPGDRLELDSSLCRGAMHEVGTEIVASDAPKSPHWNSRPGVAAEMISCLGLPVLTPDGAVFGTICVLDDKESSGPGFTGNVLRQFKLQIELGLKLCGDLVRRGQEVESLRRDRDLTSAILDTSDALVVVLDVNGRIVRFNRACERTTGYSVSEVQGKYFWDLLLSEETEAVRLVFKKLRVGLFPNQHENYWLARDGGRRLIAWTNTAIVGDDGDVEYVVGTGIDISDRRRAEEEKDKLKEHLYQLQKMEAMGQLAGGLAHDFGNLLAVIRSCTERLASTPDHDLATRETLSNSISQATIQATNLTRSLLTISRHGPIERRPLLLAKLIDETVDLLRRILPSSIKLVVTTGSGSLLQVNADGTQLQQVLMNLGLNSRDAMPNGGQLNISLSPVQGAVAPLLARISVADTGSGMIPEVRARILEPFFTTKPQGHGTGLGLAIVDGIIKELGGSISVESEVGRGTTVHMQLPCIPPAPGLSESPCKQRAADGIGVKVLLVEADAQLRGLMTFELRSQGYDVTQAADGNAARVAYQRHRGEIRAIVADADAHDADALDWLCELNSAGAGQPVIVVVGGDATEIQERLGGNSTVMCKPFRSSELGTVIERMLQENGGQAEARP
jgi:PAS domain S-box-containing protein